MNETSKSIIKVGILLCAGGVQFLDASAVDLLAICTPEYMKACQLPDALVAMGKEYDFRYIAESGPGSHITLTGGVKVLISDSFESVGKLDYLIIPGPEPTYHPTPAEQKFIKEKYDEVDFFFTVCTGILPALHSGILSGKRVTAPRGLLPLLRNMAPNVQWTEKRWEVDDSGKLWTSGGVTNGHDMMAAFIKTVFTQPIPEVVRILADVDDRGVEYSKEFDPSLLS